MKIELLQTDITELPADAIVNAANSSLLGGGGVDGAIHRKGGKDILNDCIRIREQQGECPTGEAVYTNAGKLPAKYVIHTVGPVWHGGNSGEDDKLRNCYLNSLKLAEKLGVKTIAFPNISAGAYKFPKRRAAAIAIRAVKDFLSAGSSIEKVTFVCYDDENHMIYQDLFLTIDHEDDSY